MDDIARFTANRMREPVSAPPYAAALEPLTAAEIRDVAAIIKADPAFGESILFETIELMDPPKARHPERLAGGAPPAPGARQRLPGR